jgi:hypothetical protein
MAIAGENIPAQKLNRIFGGGVASYEIRVSALLVGLLFGILEYILPLLIVANCITIVSRFLRVSKYLHTIDSQNLNKKVVKV